MSRVYRIATDQTRPLSLNDRMAWPVKARLVKAVRTATARNARALRIPRYPHVHVRLEYVPRDNRRRDTDNLWATAKPAIDALVDAGVVADDTSEYVTRHEPRITPKDPAPLACRLWLVVWPGPPGE